MKEEERRLKIVVWFACAGGFIGGMTGLGLGGLAGAMLGGLPGAAVGSVLVGMPFGAFYMGCLGGKAAASINRKMDE